MNIWETKPLLDEYWELLQPSTEPIKEPTPPKPKPLNNQQELDKYNESITAYNAAYQAWKERQDTDRKRERELYWQIKAIVVEASQEVHTRSVGKAIYPIFQVSPYQMQLHEYTGEDGGNRLLIDKGKVG